MRELMTYYHLRSFYLEMCAAVVHKLIGCFKETEQTGVTSEEGVELLHESVPEAVLGSRLVQSSEASTSTSAAADPVSEIERSKAVVGCAEDRVELGPMDLAVRAFSIVCSTLLALLL